MTTPNRDVTLGVSVVLSTVSLVLLLVVTCYFQTSLRTLEHQVELDKELLLQLQEQVKVSVIKQYDGLFSHVTEVSEEVSQIRYMRPG